MPFIHDGSRYPKGRIRRWKAGRLLRRRSVSNAPAEPGLVMVKIDGLSYTQFQKAVGRHRLPYLAHLAQGDRYTLQPLYSGVPSATPAVQGELFYGVKTSIPGFSFFDRGQNERMVMVFPDAADRVARLMETEGKPLLKGGRSYSNVYIGGADEARYCSQTMKLRSVRQMASSAKLFLLLLFQPWKMLRMVGYGLTEAGLALFDCFRGVLGGRNLFKELKFIPTRVLVCILLRELIRTRVKMDVSRGVRIVHASFLGYDEQAHRRGPGSAFAHWTLKGIDDAIREIHRAAQRSRNRRYALVVYSDHGQEDAEAFGGSLRTDPKRVVAEAVGKVDAESAPSKPEKGGSSVRVRGWSPRRLLRNPLRSGKGRTRRRARPDHGVVVTAMGPLGHVYLPSAPGTWRKERLAETLVTDGGVPLVLFVADDRVVGVNRRGRFDPETQAGAILGEEHPFLDSAGRDLARTCRHPNAGDLVISGWSPDAPPVTFAVENGAHGGPGTEETRGFLLLPESPDGGAQPVVRPADLRNWVFNFLGGGPE